MLRQPSKWNDAASSCENLGATLVTIPDFHVDDALLQFVSTRASTVHIGLRYDDALRTRRGVAWRWVNGKSMTYAYWSSDVMAAVVKPAGKECAVAMLDLSSSMNTGRRAHAEWRPVSCDFVAPAVCEIRLGEPPVNGSRTPSPVGIGNGAGPNAPNIGSGAEPNAACKDTSPYQCGALKAIMCTDVQYAKYVRENCAATCGLC